MLASINPLGERARNSRWSITVSSYAAGQILGGLAIGVLSWTGGRLGGVIVRAVESIVGTFTSSNTALGRQTHTGVEWFAIVVITASLVAAALDGFRRVPSIQRQVNEDWLTRYRGWVYGLTFGAQLGFGIATTVTTSSVYLLIVFCMLTTKLFIAAVLGTLFGFARFIPLLLVVRADSPEKLIHVHRKLASWEPKSLQVTVAVLFLIGITAFPIMTIAGPYR